VERRLFCGLFGMNAACFLRLTAVFLSFLVVFLGVSDRAKMVVNTTTFVVIMTRRVMISSKQDAWPLPVCSGELAMWLSFDCCAFVAFVFVGGDMQSPTQQLSLSDPMQC
jgi:hypothetical protein